MELTKSKKILRLSRNEGFEIVNAPEKPKRGQKEVYFFIQASEIGFSIALPIVLGALFGLWLDKKLSTAPNLTLLFLSVGIFMAFTNLYLVVKNFSKKKYRLIWPNHTFLSLPKKSGLFLVFLLPTQFS